MQYYCCAKLLHIAQCFKDEAAVPHICSTSGHIHTLSNDKNYSIKYLYTCDSLNPRDRNRPCFHDKHILDHTPPTRQIFLAIKRRSNYICDNKVKLENTMLTKKPTPNALYYIIHL